MNKITHETSQHFLNTRNLRRAGLTLLGTLATLSALESSPTHAQDPITADSQPNNRTPSGPDQPLNETPVMQEMRAISQIWNGNAEIKTAQESYTGVTDEKHVRIPNNSQELDTSPGVGELGLDPNLTKIARKDRLLVLAHELGVISNQDKPSITLYNNEYSIKDTETISLPINCNETSCSVDTRQLPPKHEWLLMVRIISNLKTRDSTSYSRFVHKTGEELKGQASKNDAEGNPATSPSTSPSTPTEPQPDMGNPEGPGAPGGGGIVPLAEVQNQFSTFGNLKRHSGLYKLA